MLCNATIASGITSEMSEMVRRLMEVCGEAYLLLQMRSDDAGGIHSAIGRRLCGSQLFLLRDGARACETFGVRTRRADAREVWSGT